MGAKPPCPPGTDGPDGTGQTDVGPWGGGEASPQIHAHTEIQFYSTTGCRGLKTISGYDISPNDFSFVFFCHNPAPWRSQGTRIGIRLDDCFPTGPPELFQPSRTPNSIGKA